MPAVAGFSGGGNPSLVRDRFGTTFRRTPSGGPAPQTRQQSGGGSPARTDATSGGTGGGSAPVPQVPSYPTSPLPLSAGDIREFAERRAGASRSLKEALARRGHGRQKLETDFTMFKNRLGRQAQRTEVDIRSKLAGRGLGFSPRFMGKGLRDVRDAHAEQLASGEADMTDRMAALEEAVRIARIGRDEEMAAINRDKARRQSDLDRLIRVF